MVLATIKVEKPHCVALAFRLLLATERGYTSTLTKEARGVYVVTASDGRAVRFERKEKGQ